MTDSQSNPFEQGLNEEQKSDQTTPQFDQSDIEKLLKREVNAQSHIKTLESETALLRAQIEKLEQDLQKSSSIDELIEVFQHQAMGLNNPNSTESTTPQLDEQVLLTKLKNEVFKDLTQAEQSKREQENWSKSIASLKEKYGDTAVSQVTTRAKELNMPIETLESLAKTSPDAFMELVHTKSPRSPAPTMGSYSAPNSKDADMEAMYTKVLRLRHMNTEEGREARRTWSNPDFQKGYRLWVIEKAERGELLN